MDEVEHDMFSLCKNIHFRNHMKAYGVEFVELYDCDNGYPLAASGLCGKNRVIPSYKDEEL